MSLTIIPILPSINQSSIQCSHYFLPYRYWLTDLQSKVADDCVQLHGGAGYMWEYPIAKAFADGRVSRIYGGSNEIMKELIARDIVKK